MTPPVAARDPIHTASLAQDRRCRLSGRFSSPRSPRTSSTRELCYGSRYIVKQYIGRRSIGIGAEPACTKRRGIATSDARCTRDSGFSGSRGVAL
jgi:hypothetical protein